MNGLKTRRKNFVKAPRIGPSEPSWVLNIAYILGRHLGGKLTIRMTDPKDRNEFCYLNVIPTGHLEIRIPKALHVLEMNLRLDLARLEAFANRGHFHFPN